MLLVKNPLSEYATTVTPPIGLPVAFETVPEIDPPNWSWAFCLIDVAPVMPTDTGWEST